MKRDIDIVDGKGKSRVNLTILEVGSECLMSFNIAVKHSKISWYFVRLSSEILAPKQVRDIPRHTIIFKLRFA